MIVAGIYAVMSGVTFLVYAIDKSKARRGSRRIPEATLHLLELLGGWPGAFAAMAIVRHKNKKASFLLVFALVVLAHLAGWTLALFVL